MHVFVCDHTDVEARGDAENHPGLIFYLNH